MHGRERTSAGLAVIVEGLGGYWVLLGLWMPDAVIHYTASDEMDALESLSLNRWPTVERIVPHGRRSLDQLSETPKIPLDSCRGLLLTTAADQHRQHCQAASSLLTINSVQPT